MSTAIAQQDNAAILERVVIGGNLANLSPADRLTYYAEVCRSAGLNPLTKPFEYLTLNGKLVLYARRDCTDQLRRIHNVSITIASRETVNDCYVVTARATMPDGRTDESIGAVALGSLKGDPLCNALMKAETKAKRRVTLSICGLGMLDESEIETIPGAQQPVQDYISAASPAQPIAPALPLPTTKENITAIGELIKELQSYGVAIGEIQARMERLTGAKKRSDLNGGQAIIVIEAFEAWLNELDSRQIGEGVTK